MVYVGTVKAVLWRKKEKKIIDNFNSDGFFFGKNALYLTRFIFFFVVFIRRYTLYR